MIWRHIKSNGLYEIVCHAVEESTCVPVVVYRKTNTSTIWTRPASEFFDGRFMPEDPSSVI